MNVMRMPCASNCAVEADLGRPRLSLSMDSRLGVSISMATLSAMVPLCALPLPRSTSAGAEERACFGAVPAREPQKRHRRELGYLKWDQTECFEAWHTSRMRTLMAPCSRCAVAQRTSAAAVGDNAGASVTRHA